MSALGEYFGQAYTAMSDTGRFVLPPAFRKAVKASSGGAKSLCLAVHDQHDCLVGFGLSRIDQLHTQLEKEEARAISLGQADFNPDDRAQQLLLRPGQPKYVWTVGCWRLLYHLTVSAVEFPLKSDLHVCCFSLLCMVWLWIFHDLAVKN